MTVIAYDIDGVLTNDKGRSSFAQDKKADNIVGVVTSRSEKEMNEFLSGNRLSPAFARSSRIKFMELNNLEDEFSAQNPKYIGSWFRDRVAARIAGWDYQQI